MDGWREAAAAAIRRSHQPVEWEKGGGAPRLECIVTALQKKTVVFFRDFLKISLKGLKCSRLFVFETERLPCQASSFFFFLIEVYLLRLPVLKRWGLLGWQVG